MTFIASVIARDGVAVIADSLVTASKYVIGYDEFVKFFEKKSKEIKNKKVTLDPQEIIKLFEAKPHHTKDFEEKLFQYDDSTAITSTGSARVNNKRISQIVEEIKLKAQVIGYGNKKIETRVKDFCKYLSDEIKLHLNNNDTISSATYLFTHFNRENNVTTIFKIEIPPASKESLKKPDHNFVTYNKTHSHERVVCAGQNRLSEKILYGDWPAAYGLIPRIIKKVSEDFKIDTKLITQKYIDSLRIDETILPATVFSEMKILKLRELSLQQAVDLANLLMHLEIDFQKYTEDIPTVGGVIKLAIINKKGFEFIAGDEIVKPINI